MAWVGTGAVLTMTSGVLKGMPIEQAARGAAHAITDFPPENPVAATDPDGPQVVVGNFTFSPVIAASRLVQPSAGRTTTTCSHTITSTEKKCGSPALDTDEGFSHTFETADQQILRSLPPKMTGQVMVA
jgi:hypothetical protein